MLQIAIDGGPYRANQRGVEVSWWGFCRVGFFKLAGYISEPQAPASEGCEEGGGGGWGEREEREEVYKSVGRCMA
jgi:hypothetical protein